MEINSQTNGNYANSNNNHGTVLSSIINNSNHSNNLNGSNSVGNFKSLLASPIAIQNSQLNNCLRVVHQKRQQQQQQQQQMINNSNHGVTTINTNLTTTTLATMNSTNFNDNQQNVAGEVDGNNRLPNALYDATDLSSSSAASNARLLGDRYLLLNQITGSSFCQCMDIRTGETFACKGVGNSYSKILAAYFRMDGDPHIKPLHKLLQSDQTYLLLPPSQYGDLHSYVRERKRLRESEARHLFRQICKTVESCHQQGIVLRDLKLRKFVFSNPERTHLKFESLEDAVVLTDPDDDILKEKIGCPAYVAPEILKPNSDFSGKAADLWSLGVILYTMLVGRYPFNDPEHSSLFAKIARCQFVIPDYVSSRARCLIKSLLQKVPKHRLTSDDILHHPWFREDNSYNTSTSSSYSDLSSDDQCVPDIDGIDFT